ncbi:hypothetical protein FRC00_012485, partial [Tulasnella sp. 408]
RARLEKLEEWRIESSLIEFSDDPPEFQGGNAVVEQAFIWVPLSDDEDGEDGPKHTSDAPKSPNCLDIKSDGPVEESECDGRDMDGSQASDTRREDCEDEDDKGETEENDGCDDEIGDEEEELNTEDVERKVGSVIHFLRTHSLTAIRRSIFTRLWR